MSDLLQKILDAPVVNVFKRSMDAQDTYEWAHDEDGWEDDAVWHELDMDISDLALDLDLEHTDAELGAEEAIRLHGIRQWMVKCGGQDQALMEAPCLYHWYTRGRVPYVVLLDGWHRTRISAQDGYKTVRCLVSVPRSLHADHQPTGEVAGPASLSRV